MRTFLAALTALPLLTAPAAAGEPSQITDVCGDALLWASAGGQTVSSPDPVSPSFDIKTAGFSTVRDDAEVIGVDLTMQLCGEAVEPENGQHYSWHWDTEAGCRQDLFFTRTLNIGPDDVQTPLVVRFSETCDAEEQSSPLWTEVETTFEVRLDADDTVTLDGDRVTVALRAQDLPEEARDAVAAGTRWIEPYVTAQMAWGPTTVFVRDPDVHVHFSGGRDGASAPDDYVVGND